ncbi:MAG TPA: PASTA domain-containing protein [Acidimicrobiales bacterium]|nr:PASTA domain-containing protein [Acidimicrobiales bacterium]
MASTRIADHLGRVLGGRYRLLAPIGTGASAHVFLADDVRLRRRVAVKILHPALADDEAFLRRFRAEARAAAALNHPHVMAVFDWGEEADGPYLVSEYLGGGSLRAVLDRGRRLTPSQALMVGLEAGKALAYAHGRGLVHRDIKPANLLFDEDGRLRIADFGLARALAEAAWTEPVGAVLGTARYASPEQVRGVPVDGKADVYSLAVVLVEAVTGRVPFAAETTVATLVGRLETPLEAPPELGPLGPVVARAGRPDPAERLDAVAFAAALQAVARELPAPQPLDLAGPATFDEQHLAAHDSDPTDIGSRPAGNGNGRNKAPDTRTNGAPTATVPAVDDLDATRVTGAAAATDTVVTAGAPAQSDPNPTAILAVPPPAPAPARGRSARKAPEQAQVTAVLTSRKGRRRRRWPWIVLLVVALLGGGAAAATLLAGQGRPSHPVPDVTGKDQATAEGLLRAARFVPSIDEQYVDASTPGTVTGQTPKAGTRADGKPVTLKEGKAVTIVVSKGPPPTPVPVLSAMTEAQAKAEIERVGHVPGAVNRPYDENVVAGQVMDWTHKGESPPKGATIDLTVSAGPAPRIIPSLSGMTYDQAAAALQAKGLVVARAPDQYNDDDSTAGKVVAASPSQGSSVARGDTVTLSVSKGRPEVPALNGLSVDDAKAKLATVGLTLGGTYGPGGGKIFLVTPSAGTKVKPGSSVDVFIL